MSRWTRWTLVAIAVTAAVLALLSVSRTEDVGETPTSPLATATPLDRVARPAEVREVIQVRGYTYLRLLVDGIEDKQAEEIWAVSFAAAVPVGQRIAVRPFAERTHFPSRQLGRTFPRLWFVTFSLLEKDTTG